MSTLKPSAPYYKKFLNGDFGHAHAAQEFALWAIPIGFGTFIPALAPLIWTLLVIFVLPVADDYWRKREVKQSENMGRETSALNKAVVPTKPDNKFWTQDAIDDVLFPRKMRPLYPVVGAFYVLWSLYAFGLFGVLNTQVAQFIGSLGQ